MSKPIESPQTASATYTQELADQLLAFEADIDVAQNAKKSIYEATRDTYGKRYTNALKLALKIQRTDDKKKAEADEVDAEAFRILEIINGPRAPRATRSASAVPTVEHDQETGEIIEPIQPETANEADGDHTGHAVQPDAAGHSVHATTAETTDGGPHESAAHQEPVTLDRRPGPTVPNVGQNGSEHQRAAYDETNEAPAGRVADESPAPLQFVAKPIRPYCQNPGNKCGGQGKKHCGKCQRAHDEQQGAA